jgi:hypothetical protein
MDVSYMEYGTYSYLTYVGKWRINNLIIDWGE